MGGDPGSLAGLAAVVLLAGMSVAAWFAGKRDQRAQDRAVAALADAEAAKRRAKSAEVSHGEAIDRLPPDALREHGDDLADRILGGGPAD